MNGIDGIFARSVALPGQHYIRGSRNDWNQPIRRLMLAVLSDALSRLSER